MDDFAPRRVTLHAGGIAANHVTATDTLHATLQDLHFDHAAGGTLVPDLAVTDYPIIIRLDGQP